MSFNDLLFVAEIIATITGIISVYLLSVGNGRGWSLGAVMITLSGLVYVARSLYGFATVQLYFLVTQFLGWRRWRLGEEKDLRKSNRALAPRFFLGLCLALTGVWMVAAQVLLLVNGVAVWADAFVSVGSLAAQTLMVAGYRECWLLWLAVDIVATVLSYDQGMGAFVLLYLYFCVMAVNGWREWTRDAEE